MKLPDLVRRVALLTDYDQSEVDLILKTALDVIISALCGYDAVSLKGFGIFDWQFRKRTQRRHPVSKELVQVDEGWVLRFRPAKHIKYRKGTYGEARSSSGRGESEGSRAEEAKGPEPEDAGDERPLGPGEGD